MIKTIYISIIVLVTIWTLYLYLDNDQKYKDEMNRITYLEHKIRKRNDYISQNRMSTIPCSVVNLETPRDCYVGSNYSCKWCESADRCNQII